MARDLCSWGDGNAAFLFGTCPMVQGEVAVGYPTPIMSEQCCGINPCILPETGVKIYNGKKKPRWPHDLTGVKINLCAIRDSNPELTD